MDINSLLKTAEEMKASDLHITVGLPPMIRINGMLTPYGDRILRPADTKELVSEMLTQSQLSRLEQVGQVDLSYLIPNQSRFRVNAYRQKGNYAAAIRVLSLKVPTLDELGLPDVLKELALKQRGVVLVTGPTGSGKSTTLAAMINHINSVRNCHVLTLEDPIEYIHEHNKSIVNQREMGFDCISYAEALRAALREDPDVILVGEMRDIESIAIAVTAAETGHLVLSTLHTTGADSTVDRIIDVFPPHQQQQIRVQLASVLQGIVSQQLLPKADGTGRVAALEIATTTSAIANLIREGKSHQIASHIQTGSKYGMRTLDYSLAELVKWGHIDREMALTYAMSQEMLTRYLLNG